MPHRLSDTTTNRLESHLLFQHSGSPAGYFRSLPEALSTQHNGLHDTRCERLGGSLCYSITSSGCQHRHRGGTTPEDHVLISVCGSLPRVPAATWPTITKLKPATQLRQSQFPGGSSPPDPWPVVAPLRARGCFLGHQRSLIAPRGALQAGAPEILCPESRG